MDRITVYDITRQCYVINPDGQMGRNIQRLGMYEDRDEAKPIRFSGNKKRGVKAECPVCDTVLAEGGYVIPQGVRFCFHCGQRIDWDTER